MTSDELQQRYPAVYDAVLWTEVIFCVSEGGQPTMWDLMVEAGWSNHPDKLLEFVKDTVLGNPEIAPGKLQELRLQMDNPAFTSYLRGKLGLV